MFSLLHGDNQVASRGQLTSLIQVAKNKGKEIIRLDGLVVNLTELKQALESPSFFASEKLIIIENFFSRPESREKKEILDYLKGDEVLKGPIQIVFWESKELSPGATGKLGKNWTVKLFKTPAVIFKLLDSFSPTNKKPTLLLLKASLSLLEAEFVFYMLARRVSQLIIAKQLGRQGLKNLAGWQQGRLVSQAKRFTLEQLINLYRKLLKVDIDIKTGQTLMNLEEQLELLVVSL